LKGTAISSFGHTQSKDFRTSRIQTWLFTQVSGLSLQAIPSFVITCGDSLINHYLFSQCFALNMSSMGISLHPMPDMISVKTRSAHLSRLILSLPLQTRSPRAMFYLCHLLQVTRLGSTIFPRGKCNEGGRDFQIRVETAEWRALADGTLGLLFSLTTIDYPVASTLLSPQTWHTWTLFNGAFLLCCSVP
jgi:hypothetical protein